MSSKLQTAADSVIGWLKANAERLTADIKSVNSPIVLFTHSGDGKQFNGCWLLKLTVSRWMFSAAEDLDLGGGGAEPQ